MAEFQIALVENLVRIVQEAAVPVDVGRIALSDLVFEPVGVVCIVEHVAVFPAQPVHRVYRHQLYVVGHFPAGHAEQGFKRRRVGEHGRAAVEDEALIFIDISASAGFVALFQYGRIEPGGLQPDRQAQPAEPGADHGCGFSVFHDLAIAPCA